MISMRGDERSWLTKLALCTLAIVAVACSGNSGSGNRDGSGNGEGGGLDGGTNVNPGGGWVIGADGGLVMVQEGGVVVRQPDGGTYLCHQVVCEGHLTECGDCADNDSDGVADERDPECLGPCDNTEGRTLLPGVGSNTNNNCKEDCYFDYGAGSGGEDCTWDHRCDPLAVAPDYWPQGDRCRYEDRNASQVECPAQQPAQCLSTCQPLTPNGCDCFGCCTFPQLTDPALPPLTYAGQRYTNVYLGSTGPDGASSCTLADLRNPAKCHPCTPVANCNNPCGACEVCIGRPMPPASCFMSTPDAGTHDASTPSDAGTTNPGQCASGRQPCGLPGQAACPTNFWCLTGCCVPVPG